MFDLFRSVSYVPILKWKLGERHALFTLRGPLRTSLLPLFLLPPSGDFDHEKGRRLAPLEHIRCFGKRLYGAWGRQPAFVDAVGIDDEEHRRGLAVHPLTELLGRAQVAKASAFPATMMNRSSEYQEAVQRFASSNPMSPICIRVTASDLENGSFAADLLSLIDRLDSSPDRVLLILDFGTMGAPNIQEVEPLAELLTTSIYNLPRPFEWLRVVAAFTSFPASLSAVKPGDAQLFPRTDWMIYRGLIEREPRLISSVAFGDYAVDSAPFGQTGRAPPSANFRYTTESDYLIVKGQQAKKPVGYSAIYPVADALIARDEFRGPEFSDGDAFFERLARRDPEITTGNASTWRWAGTDHHLARVVEDLRSLAGRDRRAVVKSETGIQGVLFGQP